MKRERNYGIDLLRIVAMLMVCLLHILGQGGVLKALPAGTFRYGIGWFLEICAFGAVNCYALISGFVGGGSKFKYSGILTLWLQVVFITVTSMLAVKIFFPQFVTRYVAIRAFFPILTSICWYYTAYFCLSFFIPLLNHLIQTMPQKQLRAAIFSIILLFSVLPTLVKKDLFNTANGYSVLWIGALYLIGGYLNRYPLSPKWTTLKCAAAYLLLMLLTTACKLAPSLFPIINKINLVQYTSPTILLGSIAMVVGFSRIKVGKIPAGLIGFFAPLTFSVYIIHAQGLIYSNFLAKKFAFIADFSAPLVGLCAIGCAVALFLACAIADLPRHYLFRWLKVSERCKRLDTLLEKKTK